ncbi:hypothetical protein D3C87_1541150 [compost metagenome]
MNVRVSRGGFDFDGFHLIKSLQSALRLFCFCSFGAKASDEIHNGFFLGLLAHHLFLQNFLKLSFLLKVIIQVSGKFHHVASFDL